MAARGEAIMLINLSIVFFWAIPIILPIMLTDFTCCSQNYVASYWSRMASYTLPIKWFLSLDTEYDDSYIAIS